MPEYDGLRVREDFGGCMGQHHSVPARLGALRPFARDVGRRVVLSMVRQHRAPVLPGAGRLRRLRVAPRPRSPGDFEQRLRPGMGNADVPVWKAASFLGSGESKVSSKKYNRKRNAEKGNPEAKGKGRGREAEEKRKRSGREAEEKRKKSRRKAEEKRKRSGRKTEVEEKRMKNQMGRGAEEKEQKIYRGRKEEDKRRAGGRGKGRIRGGTRRSATEYIYVELAERLWNSKLSNKYHGTTECYFHNYPSFFCVRLAGVRLLYT